MKVKVINLNKCEKWNFENSNIKFLTPQKKFFSIIGIKVSNSSSREVGKKGWSQPIIRETNNIGGIVGLDKKKN